MLEDFVLYVAVGFGAQLVDGAIGMAYGLSGTTVMLSFGIPPATASASVNAAEVFTTGISGFSHWRFGNVDWSFVRRLALPGMAGGALGAYLLTTILRNAPSFQSADGSKDAIRQLILTSLKSHPQISAAYVGYENGDFFHALSITEAENTFVEQLGGPPLTRFAIQEIRADNGGARVQTWLFFDGESRQI